MRLLTCGVLLQQFLLVGADKGFGRGAECLAAIFVACETAQIAEGAIVYQQSGHCPFQEVWSLRRVMNFEVTGRRVNNDHTAACLHGLVRLPRAVEGPCNHSIGVGKNCCNVTEVGTDVTQDVAVGTVPQLFPTRSKRLVDRAGRLEFVVINLNQFESVLSDVARFGQDQRNRISDMADLVLTHAFVQRGVETLDHEERRE